jgi:hypothetical protein
MAWYHSKTKIHHFWWAMPPSWVWVAEVLSVHGMPLGRPAFLQGRSAWSVDTTSRVAPCDFSVETGKLNIDFTAKETKSQRCHITHIRFHTEMETNLEIGLLYSQFRALFLHKPIRKWLRVRDNFLAISIRDKLNMEILENEEETSEW